MQDLFSFVYPSGYISQFNNLFDGSSFDLQDAILKDNDTFVSRINSIMSFDTVRFGVPMSLIQFETFKECFIPYQSFTRFSPTLDIESSNDKFQLITADEMNSLTSDVKIITCFYSPSGHVIFELSIPKILYGHNSLMFWQLDTFFHRFRNYLNHVLGFEVEHWEKWLLKRVDVCYNYHLTSLKDVEDTLSYLSDLRMRNRACVRNSSGKNIAYWAFQTRTIKFYSKYHEMLKHKKSFDPEVYDIVLENSKNILRFEEEWRSKYLLSKLHLHKVDELTVKSFIDYVINYYNRNEHLKVLLGEASMIDKKFSLKDTFLACKSLKKPNVYIDFITSIIDIGLDKTKKSMPKNTYYDRVKVLKSIGIDVSVINERFHQSLENQHDKVNTDFTKAPLSNLTDYEAHIVQSKIKTLLPSLKLQDFLLNPRN